MVPYKTVCNFVDGSVQRGAGQEVFHQAVARHLRAVPHQVHSLRHLPRELLKRQLGNTIACSLFKSLKIVETDAAVIMS